jgi:hypothetical protein
MIKVHFLNGGYHDIEQHYNIKEYRDDVVVEIGSLFYEVYFYTPNSLHYEMNDKGLFSYPGIIILDEIT